MGVKKLKSVPNWRFPNLRPWNQGMYGQCHGCVRASVLFLLNDTLQLNSDLFTNKT